MDYSQTFFIFSSVARLTTSAQPLDATTQPWKRTAQFPLSRASGRKLTVDGHIRQFGALE